MANKTIGDDIADILSTDIGKLAIVVGAVLAVGEGVVRWLWN